jgi:hypothetical protein
MYKIDSSIECRREDQMSISLQRVVPTGAIPWRDPGTTVLASLRFSSVTYNTKWKTHHLISSVADVREARRDPKSRT